MAVTITVMYPVEAGSRFDWDYFLNSHIPTVETSLAGSSLLGIKVSLGLSGAAPGEPAVYQAIMIISYESMVAFHRSWRQRHHQIVADVSNFTNTRPEFQISEDIVLSHSHGTAKSEG